MVDVNATKEDTVVASCAISVEVELCCMEPATLVAGRAEDVEELGWLELEGVDEAEVEVELVAVEAWPYVVKLAPPLVESV